MIVPLRFLLALCMPKIRSERNNDEVRPTPVWIRFSHGAGFCGKEVHPSQAIDAFGVHRNILHSFTAAGEGMFH